MMSVTLSCRPFSAGIVGIATTCLDMSATFPTKGWMHYIDPDCLLKTLTVVWLNMNHMGLASFWKWLMWLNPYPKGGPFLKRVNNLNVNTMGSTVYIRIEKLKSSGTLSWRWNAWKWYWYGIGTKLKKVTVTFYFLCNLISTFWYSTSLYLFLCMLYTIWTCCRSFIPI